MSDAATFELQMSRFIRASRERVYDALVREDLLRLWKCPRGMTVTEIDVDHRVGGAWRLVMRSRDGSLFKIRGVYCELEPPRRVAYTWQWEEGPMPGPTTLVEVDLSERDGGTLLEMRHSGFPAQAALAGHERGWNSTYARLVDLLDPRGSAATLTLYGVGPSSYTRTARLALAEKGIAYTLEACGPHSPGILAVNPFGRLPALTDGDLALYETSAIVRYLDECFDGPRLVPGSIVERAVCEQWVSVFNSTFYAQFVLGYIRPSLFPSGADGQPERAPIEQALAEMPVSLALIDGAYAKSTWLAAETLSMADLFLMPMLAYLERLPDGPRLLAATPHLRRALAAMRERPSFPATDPGGRFTTA
ncbi:MAG: SRPBCC domain-containing protein [Caldimonas sp.]